MTLRFGDRQNSLTIRLLPGGALEIESESSTFDDCYRSRIVIEPNRVLKLLSLLKSKQKDIERAIVAERRACTK